MVKWREDRVYLNADLNLKILAQCLETSEKTCSHVLSKGLESNFNQFVNRYRVEAFKDMIAENRHEHMTLSGLAYECGFESKSTFNRSFKQFNKMTPSQYIKSIEAQ